MVGSPLSHGLSLFWDKACLNNEERKVNNEKYQKYRCLFLEFRVNFSLVTFHYSFA